MAVPPPKSPDGLESELADLQSSHDLIALFLKDSANDAGVPDGFLEALAGRAARIRARISALRAEVGRS